MTDFFVTGYETPNGLLKKMRPWLGYIQNAAHVKLEVVRVKFNGFELIARWGDGKEHKKHYSVTFVRENKKIRPCDHARAFLREILERRGVA